MIRHTFPVSEQRAASHCDALVKPSAPVADLVPQFEQLGARITRPLARAIAQAWGDPAIEARLVAIRQIDGAQLAGACSELSVASLHQFGRGNHTLMLSIDAKVWGVVVMGGAVVILFFLPWLDHSPVKSIRYRPDWHKYLYAVFVIIFLILGYLGVQPPSPIGERVSQVGTLFYFGFFLLMPWWSRIG